MGHLFISYARKDTAIVDSLVEYLKKEKISIWIDRSSIEAAGQWPEQITNAIKTCDCFLLIVSNNSIASPNVLAELNVAHQAKVTLLPLFIDKLVLPSSWELQLAGIQFLEIDPDDTSGFDRLIPSLELILGRKIHKKRRSPPRELTHFDKNALADMLTKVGLSSTNARMALCYRIGIDPKDIYFLTDTSTRDFAELLIHWLDDTGRDENLVTLCHELTNRLGSQYRPRLKGILSKLSTNTT